MEMKEVFDKLKALQDILAEKYSIQTIIEDAPKRLTTQDEYLTRLKKEYIEKNAEHEEKRLVVGRLKSDLAEAEAARERGEKGMDSITTHREYEALQKEIDDASNLEQQIRKDLQKEEKLLAELDEDLKQKELMINSQETELNEGKKSLDAEIDGYKKQLEELKEQEKELENGVDADVVFKFERIIKSKQGKGIVPVRGNVCDGCHMILPAQFANEVHNGDSIVFCPYCSRILFYQDTGSDEDEYYQIDDTGSLVDLDDGFDDFDDEMDEDESEREDVIKDLDFE